MNDDSPPPAPPRPVPGALPAAPLLAPARPLRTGLALLLPVVWVMVAAVLVLALTGGGLGWLLATEAGSAWLLARLPAVQVQGFSGALFGPQFRAERLRVGWDGGRQWLQIDGLQAQGLVWQWRPQPDAWLGLQADQLLARRVELHTGPPGPRPIVLPARLKAPLQVHIAAARVEQLVVDASEAAQALQAADLVFDPGPGGRLHIGDLTAQAQGLALQATATLRPSAPYELHAQATLRPAAGDDAPAWAAVLKAQGPLADLAVQATLRGRPQGRLAAPALDLRAQLQPLQAWMLGALDLQTEGLDLAALHRAAPSTRLTGTASLQGGAQGRPLTAQVTLDNATPGRWDAGRLPVRQLRLALGGQLQQPERIELTRFDLQLADHAGNAGRWSGTGQWLAHTLTLDTHMVDVRPQRLDARAAAMTLSGPVTATLRGLTSPDPRSTAAVPARDLSWEIDLQGRLGDSPQAVQVQLEGRATEQRLTLSRARATAGSASAELSANLARAGRGDWQIETQGKVVDFDPLPWWPGEPGSPWRRGPHRFSGDWTLALRVPGQADKLPLPALAQRVAGNGRVRLQRSLLAGVPLAGEATLAHAPAAGVAAPARLLAMLDVGGNVLRLEGRGDPTGSGADDRWKFELDAGALKTLAPLAALSPALAEWAPGAGSASATLTADGRWPAMRTAGQAQVSMVQAGALSLARGSAQWALETAGERPLTLQLDLGDLRWQGQRADHLRLGLRGTLAEHAIDISGAMPLVPPAAVERLLGIRAQAGTQARMQARGQWLPKSPAAGSVAAAFAEGGRWQAHIDQLVVGAWDGTASVAAPASVWLRAADLQAGFDFDADGRLATLQTAPGRVRIADRLALRWDEVTADLRGARPQLRLHADVEAFALAPLLARLQPDMGWQGDLRLAARIDIDATEKMDAELVFERVDGDLHVAGSDATQLLGLSELRLAVSAHEGQWAFRPVFRGRSLGELRGELQVRSTPEARWPGPDSPTSGQLRAQVADVGIWGAWLPPGWRLAGTLDTTATVSGPFRSPLFNGELKGSGLGVRNLLQGVNVRDGEVHLKLEGDSARIERFTLRSGEGSLTVTGGARLVDRPEARLQFKAERFRVLGRVDRMATASGDASLVLTSGRSQLDGRFRLDEALYDASRSDAPSLDDDVTVSRNGEDFGARTAAVEAAPRHSFVMGLDLDLGENVRVRGRGLDTALRGELRLTTPGGRLAVNGAIRTLDGTYAAYGQALEIERGIVAFSGPPDNPRLDVLALRPNIDQRVGVAITGNLLTPRVRLFSEPEMGDSEKLSWLVLGRASDGLGRTDTALLQRAAVALLAGEGEAPTDALMRSLGIDEISLRQGDGDVRETVITVGKQLSRRWYLGYERGVNATTGTWQLIYRIAQRFTLRAQSGQDSALDVIWTWRTQETPADAGMRKSTVIPR